MQYDFLRHIVNPILNKYIEKSSIKVIGDIKRMFQRAEDVYRFSIYNGDVNNLVKFLRSMDFLNIIGVCKTNGLLHVLIEVLEETRKKYSSSRDIVNTIDDILRNLEKGKDIPNEPTRFYLKDFLSKELNPIKVRSSKNGLKITLRENIVVKVKPGENSIDVEITVKRSFPAKDIQKIPEMVKAIGEKIGYI